VIDPLKVAILSDSQADVDRALGRLLVRIERRSRADKSKVETLEHAARTERIRDLNALVAELNSAG